MSDTVGLLTPQSLYRRVFLGAMFAVLAGLSISGWMGYFATRHEVRELFDAQLIENTNILKGLLNQPNAVTDWPQLDHSIRHQTDSAFKNDVQRKRHAYDQKLAVQIWSADHRLRVRSPSAPIYMLSPYEEGFHQAHDGQYEWLSYTVWLDQNQHWLVVAERSDIRSELALNVAMSLLLGAVLGLGAAFWLLRREVPLSLQPLSALGEVIAQRDAHDLSPIALSHPPRELRPVIAEMNLLLDRVNQSVGRERRFLADAAHELRTPLAVIRLHVQQALSLPVAQQHDYFVTLLSSVDRHQNVVEQLLQLARLDSDLADFKPISTRVDRLVRDVVADMMPLAFAREISLEVNAAQITAPLEPTLFAVVIRNVVDNAIRHTPVGCLIEVLLSQQGDVLRLSVLDQGEGMDADALARVTERFWQAGQQVNQGSGLGMAIVQTIMSRHGGHVEVRNRPEGGLQVDLVLPVI